MLSALLIEKALFIHDQTSGVIIYCIESKFWLPNLPTNVQLQTLIVST